MGAGDGQPRRVRFRHQPWGIFGGQAGRSGRYLLREDSGPAVRLDDKPMGVSVTPAQSVVIETLGAGGYGPPAQRDRVLLQEDVQSGKFTLAYIRDYYGLAS